MSIWGPSPVENDDAADWLSEFSEEPNIVALTEAFDEVLSADSDDYLEIPECSISIMAAAVVREIFYLELSEYLLEEEALATLRSLSKKLNPSARVNLVKKALKSVQLVMRETDRSELFQVIQEDLNIRKIWLQYLNDLIRDLDKAIKISK